MKLPLSWLCEYVPVEVPAEPAEVARRLTAAGLEVESVERPATTSAASSSPRSSRSRN